MTGRIIITTALALFATSMAFSQMRYSRRSSSPQPQASPTPTPTPANQGQLQKPPQKIAPTPTPSKQVYRQQQTFSQTMPPPLIRARQAASQPQTASQGPASMATQPKQANSQPPIPTQVATPAPIPAKPTPTPVPPPDINAYLNRQLASSKDKKFHLNANGKDLPLTPFHVWASKSTGFNTSSTHIDMKTDEGRIYDIEFMTTGAQVTNIRVHRINGEEVR